jgi:hypothetical protein
MIETARTGAAMSQFGDPEGVIFSAGVSRLGQVVIVGT